MARKRYNEEDILRLLRQIGFHFAEVWIFRLVSLTEPFFPK